MSRKDTILIAVIINAGLLAILFVTAIIYDTDKLIDHAELDTSLAEAPAIQPQINLNYIASSSPTFDEMDHEIKNYREALSSNLEEEFYFQEPDLIDNKTISQNKSNEILADYVEIVVKKGDSLDKIARANRATVDSIKKANQLNHERLAIGQRLKIPTKNESTAEILSIAPQSQANVAFSSEEKAEHSEAVYHIVKSGDSPWKIAKQYGVNYEQILKLNHLDEDKARNLKIGDRIRVK